MKQLSPAEFLSLVWPKKLLTHEMLELRVVDRADGKFHNAFASSISEFLQLANKYKDREVYFSVATRLGPDGTKKGCYRLNALWCDLDKKTIDDCNFLADQLQPDILVNSGGGVHAYWLLDHPVLVRDRWPTIENRTRWLAKQFGGDINTTDVSRILRVPSFFNHKYSPAQEVKAFAI